MAHDISEVVHQHRSRDWTFYLVLFGAVGPVWLIVPACWGFVIYATATSAFWNFGWLANTAFAVALFEVFFSIYYSFLAWRLSGPTTTPIRSVEELQVALTRVIKSGLANLSEVDFDTESLDESRPGSPEEDVIQLDHDDPRAIDFRNSFRTWFGFVPWSQVRLHEVRQWLYWALFNAALPPLETLPEDRRAALDAVIELFQKRVGRPVPEGHSPHIKTVRLSVDRFNACCRPFLAYVLVFVLNYMAKSRLRNKYGVKFSSYDGLEYGIHIPDTWDPTSGHRPIVFFHGLGLGISQYKLALSRLLQHFSDRPLLVVLQPHLSQDIFHPNFLKPMTREQTTELLARLLDHLGWADLTNSVNSSEKLTEKEVKKGKKGVTMLSHSNGTYCHGWMLKDYPHMITRSCFVDPVAFCCWEGDVCYNFLYRPCTTGIDLIMRYFVGTEIGVANLLQRQYDWSSNALWYEEIPNARDYNKTFFVLGGNDVIVKAQRVTRYLTSHGIKKNLYLDPKGHHGEPFLINGESHDKIISWLRLA
ncbi:hypothetical protein EV421DRAFT_1764822 [Armillaria borealis]|uniref:Alpha/beta-hydrolase n=1 Tax=Armillaria borealis TaxID=47425 RepID=A0AA39K3A9_9AGAR|nr:hypothetical protein EV421DRAFT_1764822 [Armillaria borealis]